MGGGNDTNIEGWTSDGLLLLFLFMFGSKIIADCEPIALDWIKDLLSGCWLREEFNKFDDEDAYILLWRAYFCEAKIQSAIYYLLL